MRDNLNASEKRLIAALDRLDRFIDRAASAPRAAPEDDGPLQDLRAENQRLSQELETQYERQAEALADCEARLAEAHRRLALAGQETARLADANESLALANRALIEAADVSDDEIRRALEAEIESLRASREAEIARMGEIIDTLDRMVDAPAPAVAPLARPAPAVAETPMPPSAATLAAAGPIDGGGEAAGARLDPDGERD